MKSAELTDPYAHPMIYDILHTPGTSEDVDVLERVATRFDAPGGSRRRWLEPACGSGRYLRVLASRGHRATGIDLDAGMLDYARKGLVRRGLSRRVKLVEADMTAFAERIGESSHDIAFIPVNSLRHLLDAGSVRRHFHEVARSLKPHGLYLVGISLSLYDEEDPSEDEWIGRRGSCTVRQVVQYLPPERTTRQETVISHIEVERPSGIEVFDTTYALRSYDARQWNAALRDSGFERVGSVTDKGKDLPDFPVNYQWDVLRRV